MTNTTQTTQQNGTALATQAGAATVEIAPRTGEIVRVGFDTLQGFEAIQRIGTMFSKSSLVPQAYQGNLANCIIAVELASRIGASPLMAMQNLYIVHGRPAWSSQFLISAFNSCGRFSAIRYRFTGEKGKDSWGCVAFATELATEATVEGPEVTIAMAKAEGWLGKNGSKWQTIPQLMLTYRAATFLVRTTAPELTMGLKTADEVEDIGDKDDAFTAPPTVTVGEIPAMGPATAAPQEAADVLKAAQEAARAAAAEVAHG